MNTKFPCYITTFLEFSFLSLLHYITKIEISFQTLNFSLSHKNSELLILLKVKFQNPKICVEFNF